ncbi:hypothetical protein X798_00476 [Onchocerca flexuosa]|uniref:Uncharacterized protein n=1 Tax=Onchocerca flexuosa TaxID=387005 RepID=A0A238C5W9_9BILA|nr:hypothetical protein X798_00476 [Onchocerca flexuosa]
MRFILDVTVLFILLCFQMTFSSARDSPAYTSSHKLRHSRHHHYHHKKRSLVRNTPDTDLLTQPSGNKQMLLAKPYWPWP